MNNELEQTKKVFKVLEDIINNGSVSYRNLIYDKLGFDTSCYEELISGMSITNAIVELENLRKENKILKQRLNEVCFGEDPEIALRYLRKIGYVDFDEDKKFYINTHNGYPLWTGNEKEKDYYIKDEELNEYTQKLENDIKGFKKYIEEKIERCTKLINSKDKVKPYGEELHLLENSLNRYKEMLNMLDHREE